MRSHRDRGMARVAVLGGAVFVIGAVAILLALLDMRDAAAVQGMHVERVATHDVASPEPTPVVSEDGRVALEVGGEAETFQAPTLSGTFGPHIALDGRTASWAVQISRGGLASPATVTIVAGADAGRHIELDGSGETTVTGLIPGLVVVDVIIATGERCRRRVLLRHRATTETSIDFGDHGRLSGVVRDVGGAPIEGALVDVDGVAIHTDTDGRFVLPRTVLGPPVVEVRAAGHARHRQRVGQSSGLTRDLELQITLRPAAHLTVNIGPGPARDDPLLLVLSASGDPFEVTSGVPQPTCPWDEFAVRQVRPGDTITFDDLPTCRLDVALLGAAHSASTTVWCRPEEAVVVDLAPQPLDDVLTVHLTRDGAPVVEQDVRFVSDNPASARARQLGRLVDRLALPLLPTSDVTRSTNAESVVRFGRPAGDREGGYVQVVAGALSIVRRVAARDDTLVIDLARPDG